MEGKQQQRQQRRNQIGHEGAGHETSDQAENSSQGHRQSDGDRRDDVVETAQGVSESRLWCKFWKGDILLVKALSENEHFYAEH